MPYRYFEPLSLSFCPSPVGNGSHAYFFQIFFIEKLLNDNTKRSGKTNTSTKASAQFKLIARFFFYCPINIYRSIIRIGNNIRINFFLVKEIKVCKFTIERIRSERLNFSPGMVLSSRLNNIFFCFFVAGNTYIFNGSLRTFNNS